MPHILRYWGLGLHHAELGKHNSTCNTSLLNMPCKAICLLLLTFVALVFTTVYLHDVCRAVSQVNRREHHLIQIRTHRWRVHGVGALFLSIPSRGQLGLWWSWTHHEAVPQTRDASPFCRLFFCWLGTSTLESSTKQFELPVLTF